MLAVTGSWQPMFYLLAVVSLVLAAVSWKVIPETLGTGASGTRAACGRPAGHSPAWPGTGSSPGTR